MQGYQDTVDRLQGHIESLRAMNDYVAPPRRTKVYANVIGYFPAQNSLMIDRGTDDGIQKHMPVVAAKGLVGIVEVADPKRSRVLLVSARSINIAAKIVGDPPINGIVHGETASKLALDVFGDGDILAGSPVVTSGFSEFTPAEIPIGIVVEVIDDKTFGTKRVYVLPAVQIGEIHEVFVLK